MFSKSSKGRHLGRLIIIRYSHSVLWSSAGPTVPSFPDCCQIKNKLYWLITLSHSQIPFLTSVFLWYANYHQKKKITILKTCLNNSPLSFFITWLIFTTCKYDFMLSFVLPAKFPSFFVTTSFCLLIYFLPNFFYLTVFRHGIWPFICLGLFST